MSRDDPPELRARKTDPSTSHQAMASYSLKKMSKLMRLIEEILKEYSPPGLAEWEYTPIFKARITRQYCPSAPQQARNQLKLQGRVRDSGFRAINPVTKNPQIVWETCDQSPPAYRVCTCPTCGNEHERRDDDPR